MNYSKKEVPACEVCQKPANQTCGGCKLVFYCSKAHQKLGWREGHKFKCCAFKVQFTDTLGRHMVATRDIKPGEMILKEKPAAIGPKMSSPANCLSCGKKLEPMKIKDVYDFYKCTTCNWPMCGPECEKAEIHKAECKVMSDRKYRCTIKYEQPDKSEAAYCVIAPLRVLLMKDSNPRQFENVMALESHLDDRMNTPLYIVLKANLVTFIIQVLGLSFDEETILKVASIFDTNAFDVRCLDGSRRLRAIYITASMMNHSCRPNTRHVYLGDDHNFAVIATVPIAKGDMITTTYTQTLLGTLDRRKQLRINKCFDCNCDRCKDPTEFGTYLGCIYCSMCNGPFVGGEKRPMLISTNPLDELAPWNCESCDHFILSRQMFWGNDALSQELKKLKKDGPKEFEEFIEKYSQTLHPNNHLVVQAKLALLQIYGNFKGYALSELPDHLLKRKLELCYDLLELADQLEPGVSRFRGTLLLDLQAALAVQTKREFETGKITKEGAQDQLMESMTLLQEAASILRVEPEMRPTLEAKIQDLSKQLETTDCNGQ